MHVVVIVLGDLGRSPRMQYHAESLLDAGHTVSLIGYAGEDLIPSLQARVDGRLRVIRLSVPSPQYLRAILPVYFLWRVVSLTASLCWALFRKVRHEPFPGCLLVQNPPAIPLFIVAHAYCWITLAIQGKRPALVIDWHNLGYSMIRPGLFQVLARLYEMILARKADGHLTVTKAMKTYLEEQMNVPNHNMEVLYDCSASMFRVLAAEEQHEFLVKMNKSFCAASPRSWYDGLDLDHQTLFTERISGHKCRVRSGRPALILSSTSWTSDEDFGILFDSLVSLDDKISRSSTALKCVVVVTGKGPQRDMYEKRISRLALKNVAIQTAWLEPADYPKLLACADVGVSLHTSTSGLDLPMKILDLFGCEVPVCAVHFGCLTELVQDDLNGRIFRTSGELSDILFNLLEPLSRSPNASNHGYGNLDRYSKQLRGRQQWNENWLARGWPVIQKAVEHSQKALNK